MSKYPTVEIATGKAVAKIAWSETHVSRCHVKWLRFHCRCERCLPAFSGMYPLDRSQFDDNLSITSVEIKDGNLRMTIDKEVMDDHVTVLSMDWLKSNCNCDACLEKAVAQSNFTFHDPKTTELPVIEYKECLSNEGKFECLSKVVDVGFCVIRNVPKEDEIVLKVAELFGPVRSTLYSKIFNVKTKPDPHNSSYTALGLPYHQDLPYYECEPGVQLLHAIEFDDSIKGGESQFVDLFKVAEVLREESPEDFDVLCRIPGTFETKDLKRPQPAWYEHVRTHIEVDYFGKIVSIHWNPGVEGTLRVRDEDADKYYKAYIRFLRILRRKELEFLFRLKANDLVMFNNHRMAHARKEYNPDEGKRHLQGCYINLDDMKSAYMVLAHKLGKKVVPPKIGNRSSF